MTVSVFIGEGYGGALNTKVGGGRTVADELEQALAAQEDALEAVVEAARERDEAGFTNRWGKLVTALISGVPWVGKLAEQGIHEVVASSAYGQMTAELARLEAVGAQEQQAARIAQFVYQLLGEALIGLGEDQHAIAQALTRLDTRFGEMAVQVREQLTGQAQVVVHQGTVSGGATGARVTPAGNKDLRLKQDLVTGKGTVGVEL